MFTELYVTQSQSQNVGPRSDAGVGIGILRGLMVSWQSQRFKKLISHKYKESTWIKQIPKFDLPKISRFHHIPRKSEVMDK